MPHRLLYRLTWPPMKRFMRAVFVLLGGFRRQGAQNVPPAGGVLFCPNHVSDADAPAVAVALPRDAWFMAKEELFHVPILGSLMRLWHGFPVRRNFADRAALRRAEALLVAGEAVVIFPEGGGNAEATLQPLHPGALLVALRADVPVVPVAIENTHRVWPHGKLFPRRAGVPVTVTFGKPLDLSDLRGSTGKRTAGAVEAATQRLTQTLAAMLHQPLPPERPRPEGAPPHRAGSPIDRSTI